MAHNPLIPLDNSAIIYPPTAARYNSHTFRLSVELTIEVVAERLLTALEQTLELFPYFTVALHPGFFWYYFAPNTKEVNVYPEVAGPCRFFHPKKNANGYLFKVHYTKNRIALEVFHALSDGSGGLRFLQALVKEYLILSGVDLTRDATTGSITQEDAFEKFYTPLKSVFALDPPAFHMKRSPYSDEVQAISARIPISDIKKVASTYKVTITEYIVSELIYALQKIQERERSKRRYKPIKVSVPVNLRRLYPSDTLRNFTLFMVVGIDPRLGHYTMEEITTQVMHQLRSQLNQKYINRYIARNRSGRSHVLIRYAPNWIKKPLMKLFSDIYGDNLYSTTMSNLGQLELDEITSEYVQSADFYLSPSKTNKVSCAAVSVGEYMKLNFSSIYKEKVDLEREVLTSLVDKQIRVEISTNRR
ncbi:MAG: hypothetical protein ACOX0W_06750 [Sphaerochaetaceae bacterium]